ncbi:MAG: serine O-acetyltransferase [Methanomassiliicoccales archaeon]|uniref:serine O-acetyltransferase EpsC n=1 Tax=Candidatus Methanarcanum hacksteinii TaxID=2911857 RepID=UPI0026F5BD66|nr:serine acetyltransferase [Candidatus Methanomethylophilaceae archaeon]MCI6025022.1 serine O-acetyltransferase [Methanomassiliicoccales archaeon]MDD7479045.1 serine O-acetyltransferase [Methanomassiliicoccales archaeon]MDO5837703.1 serine O-acetyltransferase EpsC [Methanomassiliicoccales archaeon]MDY4581221.1 serine O-acetyltransferase EpsC [Candidatus Methanarcanum hacksteinii]
MKIRDDDLAAVMECDPSVTDKEEAIEFHMGLHVVSMYRESHELWLQGKKEEALRINYECHSKCGADIHPGATIGNSFFIDHATGIVIGETTIIGDHVMIYQGVTLGGVSTSKGKRHPTIGNNVVIGTGAIVLGNITIGNNVRIGAGSVVLKDIPDDSTVVGVPGEIVKHKGVSMRNELDHSDLPDPVKDEIESLKKEIQELKEELSGLKGSGGCR